MEIEIIKKLIQQHEAGRSAFLRAAETADRYYRNMPDIIRRERRKDRVEQSIRNADNRIPFNFYGLLVNQKASYTFTTPPVFDIGDEENNKRLDRLLGDEYDKVCKDLCVDASNASVAWLHVWKDGDRIEYAEVPANQIIPVWDNNLKRKLYGVFRTYRQLDEEDGQYYNVYEYWNDTSVSAYRVKTDATLNELTPYYMFIEQPAGTASNTYEHGIGEVPFFPFNNNNIGTTDLVNVKELIDSYCKVYSGFMDDLEDIQEVILILTNYSGQDPEEFLNDLKYYKIIKTENYGDGDKSGVDTLSIQIPVDAREKMLELTRKCIFEQGQGIDPDPQNFGNSSGVALKYLYSLLELKAGLLETEFRLSFGQFIRCMCRLAGIPIKDDTILQTWTRTSVNNDQELAQIAQQSEGILSKRAILSHHPWVDDVQQELDAQEMEQEEQAKQDSLYSQLFNPRTENTGETGGQVINDEEPPVLEG